MAILDASFYKKPGQAKKLWDRRRNKYAMGCELDIRQTDQPVQVLQDEGVQIARAGDVLRGTVVTEIDFELVAVQEGDDFVG
ncbi:MAG: hypothetical protein WBC70_16865 [Candidatus Aminicenantales bacterium]